MPVFPKIQRVYRKIAIFSNSPFPTSSFDDSTLVSAKRKTFNVLEKWRPTLEVTKVTKLERNSSYFVYSSNEDDDDDDDLIPRRILEDTRVQTFQQDPTQKEEGKREEKEERRGEDLERAKRLVNAT